MTTYSLLAEALDGNGAVVSSGSVAVASTNQSTFDTAEIALLVPATVETYAGSVFGNTGTTLDDALFSYPRDVSRFAAPHAIAVSTDGSRVYVADHYALRQIGNGKVVTLAGSGQYGAPDGKGSAAQFNVVWGMALLSDGSLMLVDTGNYRLRKVILP